MERRKIFGLVLTLLLFINFSFSQDCNRYFLSKYPDIVKAIIDNKEMLELTQQQIEAIEASISNYEPLILDRKKQIEELEAKLDRLIIEGGNASKIKETVLKLAQLKAENLVLKIKEIREVQNNLTESQYKKILSLIEAKAI